MKILVVSNMYPSKSFPFYGTFVKNFCEQLKTLEIKYDLSVKYKTKTVIGTILSYLFFYVKTVMYILFKKYDIIYIHYASHSSSPVLFAMKVKKNLTIYTNVHGSDVVPESKKQKKMQKYTSRILDKSKKIIVPSLYFKDYVINKYSVRSKKVFVYPSGGVNPMIFYRFSKENKDSIYSQYQLKKEYKYIGYVSRITKDKGWDIFCLALNDVLKNKQRVKAIIVGSGEEEKKLQQYICKLNLENDVILFPSLSQKQLNEIYNIIDFLVFPSKREGESLGLVPLEAMAAGTLVIVNDFAAPGSYITDKENGYKYKTNDYKDLVKKINYCLSITDVEKNLIIQNAYKTVDKYLTNNVILQLKGVLLSEHN